MTVLVLRLISSRIGHHVSFTPKFFILCVYLTLGVLTMRLSYQLTGPFTVIRKRAPEEYPLMPLCVRVPLLSLRSVAREIAAKILSKISLS